MRSRVLLKQGKHQDFFDSVVENDKNTQNYCEKASLLLQQTERAIAIKLN